MRGCERPSATWSGCSESPGRGAGRGARAGPQRLPRRLEYCGLTAAGCGALAAALRDKPDVKELVLSNNELGDAGVRELVRSLAAGPGALETLK